MTETHDLSLCQLLHNFGGSLISVKYVLLRKRGIFLYHPKTFCHPKSSTTKLITILPYTEHSKYLNKNFGPYLVTFVVHGMGGRYLVFDHLRYSVFEVLLRHYNWDSIDYYYLLKLVTENIPLKIVLTLSTFKQLAEFK